MKRFALSFMVFLVVCGVASRGYAAETAGAAKNTGASKAAGASKAGGASKSPEAAKAGDTAKGDGAAKADDGSGDDAAKAESAVKNFEGRLESLTRELSAIRLELEDLTREMLEGETGVAQIFLRAKAGEFADKSISVSVDNKLLVSRPLTPAELNVLGSDLPLELGQVRLGAGEHRVQLQILGTPPEQPSKMPVTRGQKATWIATVSDGRIEWNAE